MMLWVIVISLLLATVDRWAALGCPIGFACGTCQSTMGGLEVVASSDHLLTNMNLSADARSARLNVEVRSIIVRSGEILVDDVPQAMIPAGAKRVEFAATGSVLRISADGKLIREIR